MREFPDYVIPIAESYAQTLENPLARVEFDRGIGKLYRKHGIPTKTITCTFSFCMSKMSDFLSWLDTEIGYAGWFSFYDFMEKKMVVGRLSSENSFEIIPTSERMESCKISLKIETYANLTSTLS
jgi:hypothetical protein